MESTVSVEVASRLAENGFSLDELVVKTKEVFEREGMGGFIGLLLTLVDEAICAELLRVDKKAEGQRCCEHCSYEDAGRRRKRFRTSVGTVRIKWHRLRCKSCGKTVIPLREFLGVKRYQPKSSELEQIVAEVVSEQNYRRTTRHLKSIGLIPVPRSTAHRWVMESGCDEIKTDGKLVDVLFADTTAYKRRPDCSKGISNRGHLKVALGVRSDGTVVPYGAWTVKNWEDIGREIRGNTVEFEPPAKLLVSDGEPGLAEGLAELVNDQQRSHWHLVRDLDVYMWMDKKGRKGERRQEAKRLAGIIGIELPEEDFQKVKDEDKEELEKSTKHAEEELEKLTNDLRSKGYGQAANYVSYASDKLFTYVRFWLKYGLISPRASSMIERMMRELGRRLKRMAHGWSECGAAKIARIIIKRITSAHEWEAYWNRRLRITGNVTLNLIAVKVL